MYRPLQSITVCHYFRIRRLVVLFIGVTSVNSLYAGRCIEFKLRSGPEPIIIVGPDIKLFSKWDWGKNSITSFQKVSLVRLSKVWTAVLPSKCHLVVRYNNRQTTRDALLKFLFILYPYCLVIYMISSVLLWMASVLSLMVNSICFKKYYW